MWLQTNIGKQCLCHQQAVYKIRQNSDRFLVLSHRGSQFWNDHSERKVIFFQALSVKTIYCLQELLFENCHENIPVLPHYLSKRRALHDIHIYTEIFLHTSHSTPLILLHRYHIRSFVQKFLLFPFYFPVVFNNDFVLRRNFTIQILLTRDFSIIISPLHLSCLMFS